MSLFFGKYQITLNSDAGVKIDPSDSNFNASKILSSSKFSAVYGFGQTRIKWILAISGGRPNSKVSEFYSNNAINKEQIISKTYPRSCFRFVGAELVQLVNRWVDRSKRFGARKKVITKIVKASPKKSSKKK